MKLLILLIILWMIALINSESHFLYFLTAVVLAVGIYLQATHIDKSKRIDDELNKLLKEESNGR